MLYSGAILLCSGSLFYIANGYLDIDYAFIDAVHSSAVEHQIESDFHFNLSSDLPDSELESFFQDAYRSWDMLETYTYNGKIAALGSTSWQVTNILRGQPANAHLYIQDTDQIVIGAPLDFAYLVHEATHRWYDHLADKDMFDAEYDASVGSYNIVLEYYSRYNMSGTVNRSEDIAYFMQMISVLEKYVDNRTPKEALHTFVPMDFLHKADYPSGLIARLDILYKYGALSDEEYKAIKPYLLFNPVIGDCPTSICGNQENKDGYKG